MEENRGVHIKRDDLVFPELSYAIVGILYDVYNNLGGGYQEKYYQRAIATALTDKGIVFKREAVVPLTYHGDDVGRYFLDFLIEDKIVLELKKGNHFAPSNISQIMGYLKSLNLKLGLLANFTNNGLYYKRIVNLN